ncbi:putative oxidoreductase [Cellulomonas phragmiteti]|uniref:Oxidoreductase n=1 Tax=Cellulomonas phragmiteti TaxID=478780 RepID=A0ABQ4DNQ4_9CELL|nr:putative oxidoreductase [Cellulomonas phragmiteti]
MLRLRVADKRVLSRSAVSVDLVPELTTELTDYRPGQFLTLLVPHGDGAHVERSYSLSSSPDVDARMSITVARVPGGRGSSWIHDDLGPEDVVQARPPAGRFVPRCLDESVVMVAAGTGIAPVFSIIKSVLAAGRGRVDLLHLARDAEHLYFRSELAALAQAHPDRLTVTAWLSGAQGRLTEAHLREQLAPHTSRRLFVCGPVSLMSRVVSVATSLGYPPGRISTEEFVAQGAGAPTVPGERGDASVLSATYGGTRYTVASAVGERVLDALLAAGVPAPFSCRAGICSACRCTVVRGEVTMLRDDGLDEEERAAGYHLACQSVVLGGDVHVDFDAQAP